MFISEMGKQGSFISGANACGLLKAVVWYWVAFYEFTSTKVVFSVHANGSEKLLLDKVQCKKETTRKSLCSPSS